MELSNHLLFAWLYFLSSFIASGTIYGVGASHVFYPEFASLDQTTTSTTSVSSSRTNKVLLKPSYHFQPGKNWINDPNGPMYYNGIYHLFYQYNPKGATWGYIVWGHSVSKDLINWVALEPAIRPSKPFDIKGAWSGSATILPGNKPVLLYTGVDPKQIQVQNIAWPANLSDPYLRKWVKPDYNPLILPTSDLNVSCFRDPTTAWWNDNHNHWEVVVGGKRKEDIGMAYLYRSKDFRTWTKAKHPLHSTPNTGNWECIDFYPVMSGGKRNGLDVTTISNINGGRHRGGGGHVKYVLKVSLDQTRYDYYTIGEYDPAVRDVYVPDNTSVDGWDGLRYDWGNFYASKSFFDGKRNRRILWGWCNESDTVADDVAKGWAGIQSMPRSVWLDSNARQLMQWPVEELEALRGHKVQLTKKIIKSGHQLEIKGITAAQADIEVTFSLQSLEKAEAFNPIWVNAQDLCGQMGSTVQGGIGPFGILTLASHNLEEYTPVFFRVFKQHKKHVVLMCSDATRSSLNTGTYKPSFGGFVDVDIAADKKISLRSLIDRSVVESYGAGGKTVITSRVYPTMAIMQHAHLFLFNNGTETVKVEHSTAWSMKTPKMNN